MSATIKDIVKDTGLSPATISKYLNGKKIAPENKMAIEASIKKLGYIPNRSAQRLRSKKSNTITILLPSFSDYFWGSITTYIEEYMQKHNYSTIVMAYNPSKTDQSETYQQLLSIQTEGCIMVDENIEKSNLIQLMQEANIPCIFLDQILKTCTLDSVTSNNYESAYEMTRYLIQHGHKRIGVIGGPADSYTAMERIRGFRQACLEHGISEDNQIVYNGTYNAQSGLQLFQKMMELSERPTAVFSLNYYYIMACIQLLHKYDLRIPDDLSLVTFDDDEIFSAIHPPITVMLQDFPALGKEAGRLLLKRMRGDWEDFPQVSYVKAQFIERDSVKDIS